MSNKSIIDVCREVQMPDVSEGGVAARIMNAIVWGNPDGFQGLGGKQDGTERDEYDSRLDYNSPF